MAEAVQVKRRWGEGGGVGGGGWITCMCLRVGGWIFFFSSLMLLFSFVIKHLELHFSLDGKCYTNTFDLIWFWRMNLSNYISSKGRLGSGVRQALTDARWLIELQRNTFCAFTVVSKTLQWHQQKVDRFVARCFCQNKSPCWKVSRCREKVTTLGTLITEWDSYWGPIWILKMMQIGLTADFYHKNAI